MSEKRCELCRNPAQMFCDSDQASLCWRCDEKVHAANFLVAKHTRTLLCHLCHRPTPWTATGTKLAPTVSVCEACAARDRESRVVASRNNCRREDEEDCESIESGSDGGENYSDSDFCSEDEEEEGENQVVPWSPSPPPPDVSFCQSSQSSGMLY